MYVCVYMDGPFGISKLSIISYHIGLWRFGEEGE